MPSRSRIFNDYELLFNTITIGRTLGEGNFVIDVQAGSSHLDGTGGGQTGIMLHTDELLVSQWQVPRVVSGYLPGPHLRPDSRHAAHRRVTAHRTDTCSSATLRYYYNLNVEMA